MADFSSSTDTSEGQSHDYSIDSPAPDSGKSDDLRGSLKGAGKSMSQQGSKQISQALDSLLQQNRGVQSFKKGGRVKKTGIIHAHKGEEVVKTEDAKKVRKFLGKKDEERSPNKKKKSKRMKGRGGSRG